VRVVTNVIWPPKLLPAMTWRTTKMSGRSMTASQKRVFKASRTPSASRAKKARSRASRGLIPAGLLRMSA
jgi:hypothetical protein